MPEPTPPTDAELHKIAARNAKSPDDWIGRYRALFQAGRASVTEPKPDPATRFSPQDKATLIEFAADRIQSVWNDVGETDAMTLAQNVVAAQEFAWLSMHFPVQRPKPDPEVARALAVVAEIQAASHAVIGWAEFGMRVEAILVAASVTEPKPETCGYCGRLDACAINCPTNRQPDPEVARLSRELAKSQAGHRLANANTKRRGEERDRLIAVIAEARAINALPAATAEDARQKSDRIELLLERAAASAAQPATREDEEPCTCSQEPHAGVEFYGYGGCAECGYSPPSTRCPSVGPSDQFCIGTTEPWHEVHADRIGTTWRDYAAKVPGAKPRTRVEYEADQEAGR